jgi:hypothetical protein
LKASIGVGDSELNISPRLDAYTPTLSTLSFITAFVVSFCGWLLA